MTPGAHPPFSTTHHQPGGGISRARHFAFVDPAGARLRLVTLKRRPEFLRVRGGNRVGRPAFVLEARPREMLDGAPIAAEETRFGFTVTKALGTAVVRNRIRRRLKAAVQQVIAAGPQLAEAFDVVVIARAEAETIDFAVLVGELEVALKRLATAPPGKGRGAPRKGGGAGRSDAAARPAHKSAKTP